jgi:hypothetical protein
MIIQFVKSGHFLFLLSLIICNIIVSIGVVLAIITYAQGTTNLLLNPSFETLNMTEFAQDWTRGKFLGLGQDINTDQTAAHSGKRSMRLGINPGSFVTSSATTIDVKPNTRYFISWWCKTEGLNQARAYLFLQTNKAQRALLDADQYQTAEWKQHFAEYVTTADETTIIPTLTTYDMAGKPCSTCFAWFDDVGIYEGNFPPDIQVLYETYKRAESGVSKTALVLSKTTDLTIWADNLAARIYRDDGLPDFAQPAEAFSLSAACNEQNYFQVSLIPEADLKDVILVPGELSGSGKIPASSISWWQVGYANIKTAKSPTTRLGPTPDPLLPPGPMAAPKEGNTTFLIGIKVPKGTKAGTYKGLVEIQASGKKIGQVPISLRVYGFTLPDDPAFRTLITFSPNEVSRFDKRPLLEIEKDICRVLADHGIRGLGSVTTIDAKIVDGKVICDFTEFDKQISWVIDNMHFNAFFLGPLFGGGTSEGWEKHKKWLGMEPLSTDFNKYFPDYMLQVGKHLREKGWIDKAYLYLWDEPEPDYFDKVVALQKLALKGDPGLKIWETTSPSYRAFWGVVKAWSVPFDRPHFDKKYVEQRRIAGDEIWVYNIPCSLEIAPQDHRLWFWRAAPYGAIGAQLWNVTFYHGIDPWETITPEPYPVGRGAKSLAYYEAGAAIMIYPQPGGGVPYASLRLKQLQKGLDDFGYLALYQDMLARKNSVAEAQVQIRKDVSALVSDQQINNRDSNMLEKVRNHIAEVIESAETK